MTPKLKAVVQDNGHMFNRKPGARVCVSPSLSHDLA
jgi:hypothetical protein